MNASEAEVRSDEEVRRRLYEYVERNGAVTPAVLRNEVRVEDTPPQSKPARSAVPAKHVRLAPGAFDEHVEALIEEGSLERQDGKLRVAWEAETDELRTDAGPVTIRPARQEDMEGVVEIIRQVTAAGTYIRAETVAEAIDRESALLRHGDGRRTFFVATDGSGADDETGGENVVGWVHIDALVGEKLSHTAELTVGVVEARRRQGIGRALIAHALDWAREAGYRKIYQTLPATNDGAIALLEREGWEQEATHRDHYRIGEEYVDEVLLATWLDSSGGR